MTRFNLRTFAAAVFSLLAVHATAVAQTLPSGWATSDIGAVGATGLAAGTDASFSVEGAGADVWGTADAFRFVYFPLAGDGTVVARVASVENVNAWTKAGVMMRESLAANARHASLFVTPAKGVAFQRRAAIGGTSTHTGVAGTAPHYVRLTRAGSTFTAAASLDGTTWTTVGTQNISMASAIYVGVAVSSHVAGILASASFDAVAVNTPVAEALPPPPPPPGPVMLRVLHWNIHHGVGTDGKYDIERLAAKMAEFTPDVISLNEVEKKVGSYGNEDQPARFAAMLSARTGQTWYYHFAQRYGAWTSTGQGNMLLSRFPLDSVNQLKLSCSRSAALIGITVNGRKVHVLSTHLDEASSTCRTSEMNEILTWMAGFPEQRIMAGDWNAQYSSSHVMTVVQTFTDAWPTAKSLAAAINYSGNCDGCTRNSRIDYVFTSRAASYLTFKGAQIFDTRNSSGYMPSDHKPMLAVYEVK